LHKLGLSYANNYLLTSALVTFFSCSFVLAASAVALFGIARELSTSGLGSLNPTPADRVEAPLLHPTRAARAGTPLFWPLAATLSYALASNRFFLLRHRASRHTRHRLPGSAFLLHLQLNKGNATRRICYLKAGGAGVLLGLTITTSMLPFFMGVVSVLYFLLLRRWQLLPVFPGWSLRRSAATLCLRRNQLRQCIPAPNVAGSGIFADTFFSPRSEEFR